MPLWTPTHEWKGQDAIVVGGGPSLASFDFSFLKTRNVIGCNDAVRLGFPIVNICMFGDASWWRNNADILKAFTGRVVTCAPSLLPLSLPWLLQMHRTRNGLASGSTVAWNFSTGAAAVNLAVSLGASRIFLLGFDMGRTEKRSHWHRYNTKSTPESNYLRFIRGFQSLAGALKQRKDVVIFNVTDGSSRLDVFPKMDFPTFFKYIPLRDRVTCVPCQERRQLAAAMV